MRITVIGALGMVGSRAVSEAVARGHQVTAVVRRAEQLATLPADVTGLLGDAGNVDEMASVAADADVVINAIRPAPGSEHTVTATTKALLAGVARTRARLLVVGGAATLTVPGTDCQVLDDPRWCPPEYRAIGAASAAQFDACRAESEVDWSYLSPPAMMQPGTRTGNYRSGTDELLIDADGNSAISAEDFAVALIDEAETPRHHRVRFTVGY